QRLTNQHPDNPAYKSELATVLQDIALVQEKLTQPEEALATYKEAISLQRAALGAAHTESYRNLLNEHYLNLARLQRELGRHAAAAATTRLRQQLWPRDAEELLSVARELALCVPLVGKGKAETSADQAERKRYADQALDALRQAVANGFRDV